MSWYGDLSTAACTSSVILQNRISFDPANITVWNGKGVDLRKESQGAGKLPSSIQRRVIERILAGEFATFDIVFDGDGTGEVADVVAISHTGDRILVYLFHCKYSAKVMLALLGWHPDPAWLTSVRLRARRRLDPHR